MKVYKLYDNKNVSQDDVQKVLKMLNNPECNNFLLIDIFRKYQALRKLGAFAHFPTV
jgi:hypothetical protein